MGHGARMNESCPRMDESCRTFVAVVASVRDVAADGNVCMNESCRTYERVMSLI